MPFIQFTALGDLLAFLTACHSRREALGHTQRREKYSRIHVQGGTSYSIRFRQEDWDPGDGRDDFTYGGRIVEQGTPPGHEIDLNEVFRRLPLVEQPSPPAPQSLVLAVSGSHRDSPPLKVLHEAWRHVPKLDGAESRFFVRRSDSRHAWSAVEIREVASQFNVARLESFRTQGLRVFAPAWPEPNCYLYIEWGYAYPKPADFAALYSDQARVRKDDGQNETVPQLLLVEAADRAGHLRTTGRADLFHARWLKVALSSHTVTEEFYDLALTPTGDFDPFEAEAIDASDRLDADFKAEPRGRGLSAADDLERHIARCGRELEELLTRKARLGARLQSAWVPAYTFEQPDGAPLPEKLRLFLRRPLGELGQYRYAVLRGPEGRRHCVLGEVAVPWGSALAVPSDGTWLCDARWREWGLPLFLRADCELNVHVDELNVAGRVRELLSENTELDLDANACILTEPGDDGGGLRFTSFLPDQSLDTAMAFFNEALDCQVVTREAIECAAEALVHEDDGVVSDAVRQLDDTLQLRAGQLLGELEKVWLATRERAMAALLQLRVTEAGMEVGEQACVESCQGWAEFVNHVLTLDERISALKLAAAARWWTDQGSRQTRLEGVSGAQRDFTQELANSREELAAARERLDAERLEIEAGQKALEAARAAAVAEAAAASNHAAELQKQTQQTAQQLTAAQDALKKLEFALEERNRRQTQLEQTIAATQRKQEEIDVKNEEIEQREVTLAGNQASIEASGEAELGALDRLRQQAESALDFIRANTPPPAPPPAAAKPSRWQKIRSLFGRG